MNNTMSIEEEVRFLTQGCVDVLPENKLYEKIEKSRRDNKPLKVKLGIDPTGTDIHLGHTVVLQRLKAFQQCGHQVILLIGDGTGMIGDPSGRSATRSMMTQEQLQLNAKKYQQQVSKVLDPEKTIFRYNSEWLNKLQFKDIIELTSQITVAQMLEREDFNNRYKNSTPISLVEFMYPIMQGYDSVALEADIEFGGQDQIFNLLVGRILQKYYQQDPQVVITLPLLEGTDGIKKMSKSYANTIDVDDTPADMFGKIMSIPDNLIVRYFELLTLEDIHEVKKQLEEGVNPRDLKMKLGANIVKQYYSKEQAIQVQQEFIDVFSKKTQIPEDTLSVKLESNDSIMDVMLKYDLCKSKSEAKRLIDQKAVRLDDQLIESYEYLFQGASGVLKVGKRRFLRVNS